MAMVFGGRPHYSPPSKDVVTGTASGRPAHGTVVYACAAHTRPYRFESWASSLSYGRLAPRPSRRPCPKTCPRPPGIQPKRPPASQGRHQKPLNKSTISFQLILVFRSYKELGTKKLEDVKSIAMPAAGDAYAFFVRVAPKIGVTLCFPVRTRLIKTEPTLAPSLRP
jgi:hypothetical protein